MPSDQTTTILQRNTELKARLHSSGKTILLKKKATVLIHILRIYN